VPEAFIASSEPAPAPWILRSIEKRFSILRQARLPFVVMFVASAATGLMGRDGTGRGIKVPGAWVGAIGVPGIWIGAIGRGIGASRPAAGISIGVVSTVSLVGRASGATGAAGVMSLF